jgi:hypothetical protein
MIVSLATPQIKLNFKRKFKKFKNFKIKKKPLITTGAKSQN